MLRVSAEWMVEVRMRSGEARAMTLNYKLAVFDHNIGRDGPWQLLELGGVSYSPASK
ncbi:hypothetical protein [Sphingomonas solaris]|uniref:hypothetical protein n=1 Tax=Alterirhizorhabdus solaris TaxID=2529389 RepID=UPI001396BA7F|nr:hypothetical protein [Sphingomonas solaris]